ncbi:MAG TPA: cyclodeaminase/cyclohydrolase family protein [Steroidobacteraceae bacterium]|nr:cyclodeaminase/cyclohydrolase family protein [Steroidobacteraceae bacterium]
MQYTHPLAERPLGAVIEAIASDDVAPGAGSAAAVGLALAAACAGKAVAITLKHRNEDAVLARAQKELAAIAHRALHGADEDAARFREFMHEKDASAVQDLLETSTRLQQLGLELLAVLERIADCVDAVVSSDIAAARALCTAFGEIQSENLAETHEAAERINRS